MLPVKNFDLTDPADARKFLRGFRMPGGQKVEKVRTEKEGWVELDMATDEQVTRFASQIYTDLYKPGGPYYVEEELH